MTTPLNENTPELIALRAALERLADRVEQIVLPDGSTPDTLEARMLLAALAEEEDITS